MDLEQIGLLRKYVERMQLELILLTIKMNLFMTMMEEKLVLEIQKLTQIYTMVQLKLRQMLLGQLVKLLV